MVEIAICAAISAILMQHLGLIEAIVEIITKISKCHQCCCFWLTLITLIFSGCNIIAAVLLSIVLAYLSNFVVLLLIQIQKYYDWLWEQINKD